MFLGLDDTDSPDGMCTTYLGALIADALRAGGCTVRSMRLIRLNPNVPWKTRGNAGVAIEFDGDMEFCVQTADRFITRYAMFDCANTNPGFVVCRDKPPAEYYYQALREFCTIEETVARLNALGARYRGYKNGRGLIGALAAISAVLPDKTYEYLAYRRPDAFGTPRLFDAESFRAADAATAPHTWDTWDVLAGKPVCLPHGKDPVLFGLRGESPEWVARAAALVKTETPDRFVIWETNQGTDAHLLSTDGEFLDGRSYVYTGTVASAPVTSRGGHVTIRVGAVDCLAFEPTKEFRDAVRALAPGDRVTVYGGYQNGGLHLEKFRLLSCAAAEDRTSPVCPLCGGRMTSAGRGKGYKCRSCPGRVREPAYLPRSIQPGWYEVPPDARRHLAKPVLRMQL